MGSQSHVEVDQLGRLVHAVPDAVLLVDRRGLVRYANPALEAILGHRPDDILGQSYEVLLPPDVRGVHVGHHRRFVAHPAARPMGANRSLRARRRDGSLVPVEISLVPLSGTDLIAAFVRDTTERQRLLDRLAATNQVTNAVLADTDRGTVRRLALRLARLLTDSEAAVHLDPTVATTTGPAPVHHLADVADEADADAPTSEAVLAEMERLGGREALAEHPLRTGALGLDGSGTEGRAGSGEVAVVAVGLRTEQSDFGAIAVGRSGARPGYSADDVEVLGEFARSCALALELADARSDLQRLALLEDHDRIARGLHDMVIQRIFAIALRLEAASDLVDPLAAERMDDAISELDHVIRDLRSSIFGLRHDGHAPLADRVAREVAAFRREGTVEVTLQVVGPVDDLDPSVSDDVVAVVREALANVHRHARASHVEVELSVDGRDLTVEVRDDGVGPGVAGPSSFGLGSLARRAARHQGTSDLRARPEGGAALRWAVPRRG